MRDQRRQLLAAAQGATIEIRSGTGLNRSALSGHCDAVGAHRARSAHARSPGPARQLALSLDAEIVDATAERLPLPGCDLRHRGRATLVLRTRPLTNNVALRRSRVCRSRAAACLSRACSARRPARSRNGKIGLGPLQPGRMQSEPSVHWWQSRRQRSNSGSVRHGDVPKAPKVERPMIVGTARR